MKPFPSEQRTRTYGVRSVADAAEFFNDKLVELGWDECEACGGYGQIQTGIEPPPEDMVSRSFSQVYDTCPNCNGFGILPTRGLAAALVKEQRKTELLFYTAVCLCSVHW